MDDRETRTLSWYGGGADYPYPDPDPTPAKPPAEPPATPREPAKPPPPEAPSKKKKHRRDGVGLLFGRFLPPHLGHQHVLDVARAHGSDLDVLVRATPEDPIAVDRRVGWLEEMAPWARVTAVHDPGPSHLGPDAPAFWSAWADIVRRCARPDVRVVFASDRRVARLTELLRAELVLVDPERVSVPVSGEIIRRDPLAAWRYLPPGVRASYALRIALVGPESSGKSTLARRLADRYATVCVAEQARVVTAGRDMRPGDAARILEAQLASEDALARQANKVLVCDGDPLSIQLWHERLFGDAGAPLTRRYDAWLVTAPDVPFVGDPRRDDPAARQAFFQRCLEELTASGSPHVIVRGDWETRFSTACAAADRLLATGHLA